MTDIAGCSPARVVKAARAWIGTPYHHQAACRGVGTDCLGLIRGVWHDLFGEMPEAPPPYTRDWAEALDRETLIDAAERYLRRAPDRDITAGTVLVFRYRRDVPAKHIGIATAPDRFIHAVERRGVVEVALVAGWRRRIAAQFVFPDRSH